MYTRSNTVERGQNKIVPQSQPERNTTPLIWLRESFPLFSPLSWASVVAINNSEMRNSNKFLLRREL